MFIRRFLFLPFMWALCAGGAVAGGCGGGDGMPRARTTGTGGTGALLELPQVVTLGGPVLTNPKVLPILYSTDPGASDVVAFLQELASTSYWGETTSEYGVGPLTVLPPVTLTTPPPTTITDAALEASLANNTSGPSPSWGAADPNTIYLFVLPTGLIEKDAEGACCTDYDGYHYEASAGGVSVPYAISCACPMFDGPGVTDLQERTVDMSHELVEAATDPFPDSAPAYTQEDDADIVWTLVTDGEVADMCEFNDDANIIPPGSTYMVQRTWSNLAAQQFDNPCVPVVTTTPYLNSFPQLGTISVCQRRRGGVHRRPRHRAPGQSHHRREPHERLAGRRPLDRHGLRLRRRHRGVGRWNDAAAERHQRQRRQHHPPHDHAPDPGLDDWR